ncbi:MAG: response regulator transcription factor [Chloroflexota bacterium]|nr:response regulator transcription factor [Chloroflexota bacterium]
MDRQIRVQVVDDNWLVRLGLTTLFNNLPRFKVVAEANTAAGAVSTAREKKPDVVIMDVRLPDGSGVDACRQIRSGAPTTRVVMLTSFADEDAVVAAILAGASGYLLKQSQPERLIAAVETAAAGGSLLEPAIADTVLRWMRGTANRGDASSRLSDQERRILPLIAEGKTNREIGATLYLSEHTVKTYVSSLLKKLQLARRAEAAAYIARLQQARAS